MSKSESVIILVGDTPSYLKPFLELHRKVFLFAFSNKPFGCLWPPYAQPSISNLHEDKSFYENLGLEDTWTPNKSNLNTYFDYLDQKTDLTRTFIKDNWNNIVLIDSSSGQSIHGVSIFFNRYVGNIEEEPETIVCENIIGAKPLQFIRLSVLYSLGTNLPTKIAEELNSEKKRYFTNYTLKLIIYLGYSIFYYRDEFMINEAYPRLVPFYSMISWSEPPTNMSEAGDKNITMLKTMLTIYTTKTIVDTSIFAELEPHHTYINANSLKKFLDDINLTILKKKYSIYFIAPK